MATVTAHPGGLVAERLHEVRRRVEAAGGDPGSVRVVAVTKGFGPEAVAAAVGAGIEDIGENYAQELLSKAAGAQPGVRWHYLGAVRRRKLRRLAQVVHMWHALDHPAGADALAAASPGARVLVEVNVTGGSGRPGCAPVDVDALAAHCRCLPLELAGLMAVGPQGDPEGARECFRWLARTGRRLGVRELSMGMSDDFEIAVSEGATILRLGRALFGPRTGDGNVRL